MIANNDDKRWPQVTCIDARFYRRTLRARKRQAFVRSAKAIWLRLVRKFR